MIIFRLTIYSIPLDLKWSVGRHNLVFAVVGIMEWLQTNQRKVPAIESDSRVYNCSKLA